LGGYYYLSVTIWGRFRSATKGYAGYNTYDGHYYRTIFRFASGVSGNTLNINIYRSFTGAANLYVAPVTSDWGLGWSAGDEPTHGARIYNITTSAAGWISIPIGSVNINGYEIGAQAIPFGYVQFLLFGGIHEPYISTV